MIDNTMMHETLREIADHFRGLSEHMVYTSQARLRFARYVDALEKADSLLQQKLKPYESRRKQPCPKCGTPRPETWFGCYSKSIVFIKCRACDFKITGDTEIAAIRAWNAAGMEDPRPVPDLTNVIDQMVASMEGKDEHGDSDPDHPVDG